jgi:hypothetical protein
MKKYSLLLGMVITGFTALASVYPIDERVTQAFKAKFPEAQEVSWHEASDLYIANFKEGNIRLRATYRKDAVLLRFTRSYQEDQLPYYIQFRVKERFKGKKIFGVVEVVSLQESNDHSLIEYFIKLEDDKNWTTIKVDSDGEITVMEKFKKPV